MRRRSSKFVSMKASPLAIRLPPDRYSIDERNSTPVISETRVRCRSSVAAGRAESVSVGPNRAADLKDKKEGNVTDGQSSKLVHLAPDLKSLDPSSALLIKKRRRNGVDRIRIDAPLPPAPPPVKKGGDTFNDERRLHNCSQVF